MKSILTISAVFAILTGVAAPKPQPQESFNAAVLAAYEETKGDLAAFRGRLVALRATSDAEGAAGETKLDADKRYFGRLRQASRALLMKLRDQRAVGPTDAIVALTMEMLQPEERVDYTVGYSDDLPQSAEAAARTDVFARLPKENRLARRSAYAPPLAYAVAAKGFPNQIKRLKSGPAFSLAADEPGFERAFAAACDARGLHLYLKFRDPQAWRTAAGLDDFWTNVAVQPGELEPERFYSGSYLKPERWPIEWESPRPGYRMAAETFAVDYYAEKDAYYVHAFLPWTAASRSLPADGTRWYAYMDGAAHGKAGSVGGAAHHEMGRSAHLTFRLSADELRRLRIGALRQAAGDYRRVRQKWEKADFWDDPHLGDAAFYAAKVKPLAAELDEAAKDFCARGDDITAAEAEELVRTRFEAWTDFAIAVERARERYLLNTPDFFGAVKK